jgi:glyoxylase-like metal-dependent hydrolase (beta-lactamase superfamily II)
MPWVVAPEWFRASSIEVGTTLLWEPHVVPLLRCNIWHVRGRDRNLLIDTGLGVASLIAAFPGLFDRQTVAVVTHTHVDHVGGLGEHPIRAVHEAEADGSIAAVFPASLDAGTYPESLRASIEGAGYEVPHQLLTALPAAGFDPASHTVRPWPPTRVLREGDVVDLGDRAFEVLHLPGHSPGSIGMYEAASGTLFSGDAVYDGPLLDQLPGSDRAAYASTMERLVSLPVEVVHAGHDPSFGRSRLRELALAYLSSVGS